MTLGDVIIAKRFCGPPDSGNGGYSAGRVASALAGVAGGAVEVTLRRPPPLERALPLDVSGDRATLKDGELLIADARPARLELPSVGSPSFERAGQLSAHYIGHSKHHFPGCFVCGPARAPGDGLRIFPGNDQPGQPMAAPWVPDPSLADDRDDAAAVRPEFLWAALDCIGYFASGAPDYPVALLGRMTAELSGTLRLGERCVVLGWSIGREGRKLHAGTAIYGEDGRLRGHARQTWILLA